MLKKVFILSVFLLALTSISFASVLLVDADRGFTYEKEYIEALKLSDIDYTYWSVKKRGVPSLLDFQKHRVTLWITDTSSKGISYAGAHALAKYLQLKGKVIMMGYQTGASLRDMWLDEAFFGFKYIKSTSREREIAQYPSGTTLKARTDYADTERDGHKYFEIRDSFHDTLYGKACAVKTARTLWMGFNIQDIHSPFIRAEVLYRAVTRLTNSSAY